MCPHLLSLCLLIITKPVLPSLPSRHVDRQDHEIMELGPCQGRGGTQREQIFVLDIHYGTAVPRRGSRDLRVTGGDEGR